MILTYHKVGPFKTPAKVFSKSHKNLFGNAVG